MDRRLFATVSNFGHCSNQFRKRFLQDKQDELEEKTALFSEDFELNFELSEQKQFCPERTLMSSFLFKTL